MGGSTAKLRDSLKCDIQHDHVLKKLTFYLLIPSGGAGIWAKDLLPCCFIL